MRQLTESEVEFTIECLPEEEPILGNASAIDDDTDREIAEKILEDLESGNEWAWCLVKVTAHWEGYEGFASLGCCSYESEASFKEPGGYYDDMKAEALDRLNAQLETAHQKLKLLDAH